MKAISEKVWYTAANAWGRDTRVCRQEFVVEEADINRVLDHHVGYRHRAYQVQRADVGRTRTVYTDGTGWTCWVFNLEQK
ncbi:hypothetical protein [Achromobacter sp. ACRQX]|uniref:hypothetical protein n=1 Tax=Achromobacter sp. ACRQX TaxID=2918181 RepID=UPI001EF37EE6|nr:hypothetical protein [Achromobacter sp. ACRQX]MCG7326845.1 hypothetical protein [Achromobacter sp. ACRQX]